MTVDGGGVRCDWVQTDPRDQAADRMAYAMAVVAFAASRHRGIQIGVSPSEMSKARAYVAVE
jgi:hypothetical protein